MPTIHDAKHNIIRSDGTDGRHAGAFAPGTARPPNSGSGSNSKNKVRKLIAYAQNLAKQHKLPFETPVELLLYVAFTGLDPLEAHINEKLGDKSPFAASKITMINDQGNVTRVGGFVDLDTRIDCARIAAPYMHNKLSSVEASLDDTNDHEEQARIARQLSMNPDIRKLFEKVASQAAEMSVAEESLVDITADLA